MSSGVIARTIVLDKLVEDFLSQHTHAIVLNIACGMDTRCYRMEGKYDRWYNIDLPETMTVRSRFFEEQGPIFQIARSAMDAGDMDDIEYNGEPVLVIIEGLTMYLTEKDVIQILDIIDNRFGNVVVLVETMSPFFVKHIKEKSIEKSAAKFTWGIKKGSELEQLVPQFKNKYDVSLVEGMKVMMPVYRVIGNLPFVRNISNKICVMEKKK